MRPDRLDCPREGVFPLNIGRYRVATPKTMSGKNEGEWFSEKWTSKTRAPKHPHFLIAKQQDSCDKNRRKWRPKYADASRVQNRSFTSRKTIHLRFASTPKPSQATNTGAPKLPPQPQSSRRQQAQQRRSCRRRSTVPKGGRREAPGSPPGLGPATATCPHISPAAPTDNDPIADRLQQRRRRRGLGLVFRTLRRPVWRLVRSSEGAGQGATHGRGRSEN